MFSAIMNKLFIFVSNKVRNIINKYFVFVTGRPLVYPSEEQITALTGHRVEMTVEFCANPPPIKTFWLTETHKLSPGQVTHEFIAQNITVSFYIGTRL